MRFHEAREGDFRIFVGALEAPRAEGYIVALVVNRVRGTDGTQREVYRDERLACAHRWASAEEAMGHALSRAVDLIRSDSPRLAA